MEGTDKTCIGWATRAGRGGRGGVSGGNRVVVAAGLVSIVGGRGLLGGGGHEDASGSYTPFQGPRNQTRLWEFRRQSSPTLQIKY